MKTEQSEAEYRAEAIDLPEIAFSSWIPWRDGDSLHGITLPGVYLLARFDMAPPGGASPEQREIIYIGETCRNSLRGRWRQFHRSAFERKSDHSGGVTYHKAFGDHGELLHVAAFPVGDLDDEVRPLFIRYVERKLLLNFALRWGTSPKCNRK